MPDRWHESDDPEKFAAGAGWLTWKVALFSVIGVLVLSGLVWLVMFGTSDLRGRGDAQRDKNTGTNRVFAQEHFNNLYQEILSTDRKITIAAETKDADRTSKQNYDGLRQHCLDTVADYNAAARNFSTEEFRDADLPVQIDPNNLETDCKEN
jgi:hypothetical protein